MATYSTQQASLTAGTTPTYNSANTSGDLVAVGTSERDYLHVKNAAASPVTLTIAPQVTSVYQDGVGQITPPTLSISIPATTGEKIIGPVPSAYINSAGQVALTWSSATSVTFAAITLPAVSRGYM
jgi:hypothetical protein